MEMIVHVEVKYDTRERIEILPNLPPPVMVVKRVGLKSDFSETIHELCAREGQQILNDASCEHSGFNHRVVITAVVIDGAMFKPAHPLLVSLQWSQPA